MMEQILTMEEAYALNRKQQIALLGTRGIKVKYNIREDEIVRFIMESNPVEPEPPKAKMMLVIKMNHKEALLFKEILEIAGAGFPDGKLLKFINTLKQKLK